MKILVTGGAGFIGSHVTEALLARGDEVVCFDNFSDYYSPARKRKNVAPFLANPSYRLYKQDIRDLERMESIFAPEGIEKIVHMAALVGVRHSVENPLDYPSVNERGTLYLLELTRRYGVRNFVFASSSSVYGANKKTPFSEIDPTDRPLAPYPASKKASEVLIHAYHHAYGLRCTSLRFFSVYGPRGRPDMAPYLFTQRISEGKEITLFDEGRPQRDWTYIDDIVQGVLAALDADLEYEVINLGYSKPVPLREFVTIIEELVGRKATIVSRPLPSSELFITHADISKARRLLGYEPKSSLEEGLPRFVDWFRREVEIV
ncbi:MAG: NAD-dependent epimerase/dehydratase family protein [Anaerolineae bacterium]